MHNYRDVSTKSYQAPSEVVMSPFGDIVGTFGLTKIKKMQHSLLPGRGGSISPLPISIRYRYL